MLNIWHNMAFLHVTGRRYSLSELPTEDTCDDLTSLPDDLKDRVRLCARRYAEYQQLQAQQRVHYSSPKRNTEDESIFKDFNFDKMSRQFGVSQGQCRKLLRGLEAELRVEEVARELNNSIRNLGK